MRNISMESRSFVDELGNLFFDVSYRDGDEVIEKRLPVAVYLSLIDGNVREKESFVTIPKLPENVIAAKMSAKDKSSFSCLSIYKAERRAFAFGGEFLRPPFPTLLMGTTVKKGRRTAVNIFALDTDEPNDDSQVYRYPFGNVSDGGNVCMGNIVSKPLKGFEDVDNVFDDFICGKTNSDYFQATNKLGLSQGELVQYILKKDKYPYDLLIPTAMTIRDLKRKMGF